MKKALIITSALLFSIGTVLAQGNTAYVDQSGDGENYSTVDQIGAGNEADVDQVATDPYEYDNVSDVDQMGNGNDATVDQEGEGNNDATTDQYGNGNVSWTWQYGEDNVVDVDQDGNGNSAKDHQTGDDNLSTTTQDGDGNISHVDQYGGWYGSDDNVSDVD